MQSLAESIACALHKSSQVLSVLYSTKYDKRDETQRIELRHCKETVPLGRPGREDVMFMMPTIDMVATGKNIERLRKVAGLSVRDLQDVFGFATPQAIYKWQHGTAMPTIDNLVVLAALLQVKIDDILVVDATIQVQISA